MKTAEKSKRYREKNREQLRLNAIKYREDNKEKIKERRQSKLSYYKKYKPDELKIKYKRNSLKKRYGITFEEYNEMFNKQEGKCGICKTPQIEIKKIFCVDHNHKTEKVRELLCQKCNVTLSYFENYDSKPYIEYLKKHKEKLN
jgi:hypothetical protein